MLRLIFLFLVTTQLINCQRFLQINNNNRFIYRGRQLFLSGVNYGWYNYGHDFGFNGEDLYAKSNQTLIRWLSEVSNSGGNSIRIRLHSEGLGSPAFDDTGFVIGTDKGNRLIQHVSHFLDQARRYNIFVHISLWGGDQLEHDNHINLIWDDNKLRTYVDRALIPIVRALKDKEALGSWEIINEPEGGMNIAEDSNPCFDTTKLRGWAGWTGKTIPVERFQRFINWQAGAIHREDPKALVTAGSFQEIAISDALHNSNNYYKDECLIKAGGDRDGFLNYYQVHAYGYGDPPYYREWSAFKHVASDYKLDKPFVIGEFSNDCSDRQKPGTNYLFSYLYNNSYDGAWSWQYNSGGPCSDSKKQQDDGMAHIRNYRHRGTTIRNRIR